MISDDLSLIDFFAVMAPEPRENDVLSEMEKDQLANPHNEPYHNLPKRRSREEIVCDLRYKRAHEMFYARKRVRNSVDSPI